MDREYTDTISSDGRVSGVMRSGDSILKPKYHLRCLEKAKSFSHLYRHVENEMTGLVHDPQLLTLIAFKLFDLMKEENHD